MTIRFQQHTRTRNAGLFPLKAYSRLLWSLEVLKYNRSSLHLYKMLSGTSLRQKAVTRPFQDKVMM